MNSEELKQKLLNGSELKSLSWKQPFASAMLYGKIETRTWDTSYRGWVLICASKLPYKPINLAEICHEWQLERLRMMLKRDAMLNSHAIGIGRLVESRPMVKADENRCYVKYDPNLFCHIYKDVQPIEPLHWVGTLGFKPVSKTFIKEYIQFLPF